MKKIYISICLMLVSVFGFSQYTKLLDFSGVSNGGFPMGSLISDGTFLYGMTGGGGTNDMGVIFKIMLNGSGYSKVLDFSGVTNGKWPGGSLIFDGTFLYGMTSAGGTNDMGVIFKIKPDGGGYSKLLDFSGVANGRLPYGSIISDGTFLYGMTMRGGTNDMGVIFKIKFDGNEYSKLIDFAGTTNGKRPYGSLFFDGTFLYGMTAEGGANNFGVIFKIKPDGTGYVKLLDYEGAINGGNPMGSFYSDGTFLYAMTATGGTSGLGIIFKIKPDGTGYVRLLDFSGVANGKDARGDLISDGIFLYGMTREGGTNDFGVIFKIKPDGTNYTKLFDIITGNGKYPEGSFYSDGTFLYGMTSRGGILDNGMIFKYAISNGIDEKYLSKNFSIYPNPSTNKITIANNGDIPGVAKVNILNIQGEQVISTTFNNQNTMEIDVSSLAKGIYLVKIQSEKGFAAKKLVIQ